MILIADSGSTKTQWCLAEGRRVICRLRTPGTNPYFQTQAEMRQIIGEKVYPHLAAYRVEAVFFYGAGCASAEKNRLVEQALAEFFPVPIEVDSDLCGAARALCGTQPGIACILGTGSNSCLYDGKRITEHIPPLGFILGDEGSGAMLGRRLAGDCLKRQLPAHLCEEWMRRYELTPETVLEKVYKQPFPNRFLASLTPFLLEHLAEPAVYSLVYDSFRAFFTRNVMAYTGYAGYPVHFTGSIAYYYRDVLQAAAAELGLKPGKIEQEPMDGLIAYHSDAAGYPAAADAPGQV